MSSKMSFQTLAFDEFKENVSLDETESNWKLLDCLNRPKTVENY